MMHDFLGGVCIYVVRAILYEFIFVQKFFTLQQLNVIILNFNYGSDQPNKPPKLKLNEEKQKLNLKYSACEMYCLIKYLSLMIGDLIPDHDEHWEMFLTLKKISDILMSPRIISSHITSSASLLEDLNKSYVKFYNTLKPKFHFLTHYPTILNYFGPVVNMRTMRYESRHRDMKANAQATSSHINLLKTIAIKEVLKFCQTVDNFEQNQRYLTLFPDRKLDNVYNIVKKKNEIEFKIGIFIIVNGLAGRFNK